MIRRSLLNKMGGGGTVKLLSGGKNSRLAVAGDILLAYDNGTKLMIVDKADYTTTKYPTAQYTRLGTVAVPGDHNVYGDGSCGVVADARLNSTNYGKDFSFSGKIHNGVASIGEYSLSFGSTGKREEKYIPYATTKIDTTGKGLAPVRTSAFGTSAITNSKDRYVGWNVQPGTFEIVPSPYHNITAGGNDSMPEGNSTALSSALGDFDGLRNCRGQLGFSSQGTNPGDWYVPALGEIWYMCARLGYDTTPIMSSTRSDIGVWILNPSPFVFRAYANGLKQTYPFLRVVS